MATRNAAFCSLAIGLLMGCASAEREDTSPAAPLSDEPTPMTTPWQPDASTAKIGDSLDYSDFDLVFEEPFDSLNVSDYGCESDWIAHTPWGGDFGDAWFMDPTPIFPFTIEEGVLRIEASRQNTDKWRSGLLSSEDTCGGGKSFGFGYYEAKMKLPYGPGTWPAFWLVGLDRSEYTAEIDVIEYIGHLNEQFSTNVIIHAHKDHIEPFGLQLFHEVPADSLNQEFHTYGVELLPEEVVFYFDGVAIRRQAIDERFHMRYGILVNLAMGSGYPTDDALDPSFMYVDYIRVYQRAKP